MSTIYKSVSYKRVLCPQRLSEYLIRFIPSVIAVAVSGCPFQVHIGHAVVYESFKNLFAVSAANLVNTGKDRLRFILRLVRRRKQLFAEIKLCHIFVLLIIYSNTMNAVMIYYFLFFQKIRLWLYHPRKIPLFGKTG